MKAKNMVLIIVSVIALLAIWLFITEREKAKRKDDIIDKLSKENESLKIGYLELLENFLREEGKVGKDVIDELQRLKQEIDHLDTEVHIELESVISSVNSGEGTKAVKDLAKIVECKLKEKVENDSTFKKPKMLHNLLEHAKDCKWISNRQFENGMKLKEIRNEESHTLAPKVEKKEIGLCLYAGIDIIYALN